MSERFPRQFGKYVLLRSLARGGMGEIYLAGSGQGAGLNKLCVIKKVIASQPDADPAKVNRFLDEAKAVLRLSHGNLVSTFDAGTVDGELFIAMEQVEGKDLREIWNRCVRTRTRIPLDVALIVAREVARALSYVHAYADLRLVHRDVAPPNILLSYFGEVKLTDFGLARSALKTEHTTPGVVFGRASYLSPEQARGEAADARTDVYSLGIVTWELLTGQPYLPIAGLDPMSCLATVRNPVFEPPSSRAPWLSAELDALLMRALAPDRQARFRSAEEFRRALSEVMIRVAPRADADRVAEFLRGLYHEVIAEERVEREHFLREVLPSFQGEPALTDGTPITGIFPPVAATTPTATAAMASTATANTATTPADVTETDPGAASGRPTVWTLDGSAQPSSITPVPGELLLQAPEDSTGLAESLHVSALRARADFRVRRASVEPSAAEAATGLWRRPVGSGAESPSPGFVGRVINHRYRIRQRIGEGGMGTVYAAEHVEIGKSVAVKILHPQYSGDAELVERFRREARAASRVGHPHIIDVTDFGSTEEGCAFFVMELLDGMDLADVLAREERLEPERAVRIAVQVCQALEAAHDAGIIHRDLKPENIFLVAREGETDFVKVLDFGIAQNLAVESGRLTNPGMAMGTPEYMSPEQAMARPVDRRSDVYALGALVYEMLLGVAPYKEGPVEEILERKAIPLRSLRLRRPELTSALDAVVRQALEPNPEDRPQTMARFEYELTKTVWGRGRAVATLLGLHAELRKEVQTPMPLTGPPDLVSARLSTIEAVEAGPRGRPAPPETFEETPEGASIASGSMPSSRARVTPRGGVEIAPAGDEAVSSGHSSPTGAGRGRVGRSRSWTRRVLALGVVLTFGGVAAAWSMKHGGARAVHLVIPWLASRTAPTLPTLPTSPSLPVSAAASSSSLTNLRPSPASKAGIAGAGQTPQSPVGQVSANAAPTAAVAVAVTTGDDSLLKARTPEPSRVPSAPRAPEVVLTSPIERARASLAAGAPDDAVAFMRAVAQRSQAVPAERTLFVDALVASGARELRAYRWLSVGRRAREALALTAPRGEPSRGAHALLGEALYAQHDFRGALEQFTAALAETPRDARLKRRVIRSRRQLSEKSAAIAAEPTAEQ